LWPEPKRRERDVLAEVRADGRVEGGWIALVQRDDGRDAEWMVARIVMWPVFLGNQAARARQQQTAKLTSLAFSSSCLHF
jgi:hypothetical protein